MKKHFIVKRDDTFGNIGLIEKGAPDTFYALEGMGIAHDCLEHFKGDSGSIDDEFQAIGCMLHLRYDTSTLRDTDILVEMIALYRFFLDDHPCKPAKKIINPDHVCIQYIANELEKFLQEEGFDDFSNLDLFVNSFIYWTNIGYKKAIKKLETA